MPAKPTPPPVRPGMKLVMPTNVPTRKLLTGVPSGATGGPAVATIFAWIVLMISGSDPPTSVTDAVSIVAGIAIGLLVGWLTPPAHDDRPVEVPKNQ